MNEQYVSVFDVLASYGLLLAPLCFLMAIYFYRRAKRFNEDLAIAKSFVKNDQFKYLDEDMLDEARSYYSYVGKSAEFEALLKRFIKVGGRAGLQYGHLFLFVHYIEELKYTMDQIVSVEMPELHREIE